MLQWEGLHEYYCMETQTFDFLFKKYQLYSSKGYKIRKFFTSNLASKETQKFSLHKRSKLNFDLYLVSVPEKRNHPSFVDITPIVVAK